MNESERRELAARLEKMADSLDKPDTNPLTAILLVVAGALTEGSEMELAHVLWGFAQQRVARGQADRRN